MPIPPLQSGHLPHGRWVCDPVGVEAVYVKPSGPRGKIWDGWITLTAELRRIVGHVPSAWVSGSFFTDKQAPGDIDCLYLIDTVDFQRAMARGDADSALLWAIATSQTKALLNIITPGYLSTTLATGPARPVEMVGIGRCAGPATARPCHPGSEPGRLDAVVR